MTPRASNRLAWTLWAIGLGGIGFGLILDAVTRRSTDWSYITQAFAFLAVGTTGLIVARKQPGNLIGWIYLGVWVFVGLEFSAADSYGYWATVTHPGAPGGTFVVWLTNWGWVPVFGVFLTFPFLLFPDGHLPSPRWRPVAWGTAIAIALWSIAFALENHDFTDSAGQHVANPYTVRSLIPFFDTAREVLAVAFLAMLGLSIASLLIRFRRSRGDEREQIKWLMIAASITLVWLALPLEHGNGGPVDFIQGFILALIPVAVGLAILKYRLYDIDLVLNKTVVYGALAAFITLVYVAIVVGVGSLIGRGGEPNVVLSIIATATVAVAFQPVRERVQRFANRLVYGKRATPYEVLAEFSERMAGAYANEDLLPRMARILAEGTGAARADVWLRADSQLSVDASWPVDADPLPPVDVAPLPDALTPVRHQGELLGALSIEKKPGDATTPTEQKLIDDLAAQTGLVLKNVGLTEQLLARLDELKASRQRLVTAQDEERRKLERNLHDGAQQQLVALTVKLRLAQQLVQRAPAKAAGMLADLQNDSQEALEDLRDLARGIYPPLLADKGLAAALASQARKSPIPVAIDADGIGRFGQDLEAAVYFCCLEALQNVAKYAQASQVTIGLSDGDGRLTFRVADDGVGFDPAETGYGTGLQGMADRLAALDGSLDVRSTPGGGTILTGELPALEGPTR